MAASTPRWAGGREPTGSQTLHEGLECGLQPLGGYRHYLGRAMASLFRKKGDQGVSKRKLRHVGHSEGRAVPSPQLHLEPCRLPEG